MTQAELGKAVGVDQTAVSKRERSGALGLVELFRIEDVLNLPHGTLVRRSAESSTDWLDQVPGIDDRGRKHLLSLYGSLVGEDPDGPQ